MINCPNCGGLNPLGSAICGACGASLPTPPEPAQNNNNNNANDGIVLYENEFFNNAPVKVKDVKNKYTAISLWHIAVFIGSLLSWIFIPIRIIKLAIAFVLFYISESNNHKNSIFLIFTRIITAIEIWGVVIALILRTFVSIDAMHKFFEYFRF